MKIEAYLNSLEKKELIYIFLSIPIVVFIIYYNFIYPKLEKQNENLLKQEKSKYKTLIKISKEIRIVKKSKVAIIPTRKKLESLKEDFKFINYSFDKLELIRLNNKKVYNIFTRLLEKANELNLNVSFNISWNTKKIPPFSQYISLNIDGQGNYINIVKYLQFIDHLESLIYVKDVLISIIGNKDNNLLTTLSEQKKSKSNNISFTLTQYSENTIKYFQNLAKSQHLTINMNVNRNNINYLDVSLSGSYGAIKSILDYFKQLSKKKNKPFLYTNVKSKLIMPTTKTNIKSQKFNISLEIVGVK
jgi:hypothetical protein